MAESEFSGMAKKIREQTEDNFDLAGYTKITIDSFVQDAFSTEIKSKEPMRVSFIVGAGRGRSGRYPDNLSKLVAEALRSIDYEEDKHADTSWDCQGVFKYQHDTDKNLKVMHVFPKIDRIKEESGGAKKVSQKMQRLDLATLCSREKFEGLVDERVWSFTSKKNLLEGLKMKKKALQAIEQKYINVQPVSEEEEELYNSVTLDLVTDKMTLLEKQMEWLMSNEQLTKKEQVEVVAMLDKRIKKFQKKAGKETSEKKKAKLAETVANLQAKREVVVNSRPAIWAKRNEKEIKSLNKKLRELEIIESRSQRTASDLKKLKNKDAWTTKRDALLEREKGWFEEPIT